MRRSENPYCLARRSSAAERLSSGRPRDRKSTRLNSSHLGSSYAVFCLKKQRPHPILGPPLSVPLRVVLGGEIVTWVTFSPPGYRARSALRTRRWTAG